MSYWNREIRTASVASKNILPISARNGRQRKSNFITNPATGALIVSPDLDLKIRNSLMAEAKRIQRGLFFRRLRLQIEK
jgi:hypothetical protein